MMDAEGRRLNGKVITVEGDAVKMDFNHPMAGNDLYFKGEITDVRSATDEELTHGHVHASHGCGCGGNGHGSCEDDDCGCEDKGSCNDEGSCGCGC
jgi:FKBP-type peptidyl-prolyl cis-trans isomerase SlyD